MAKRTQRIQDLQGLLNGLYPAGMAEEWDNVGLQVGDPLAPVERVLVALDPSLEALAAAEQGGAQALITHHPLIFQPLRKLTPEDPVGRIVWAAVERGVAILAAHTNLDNAAAGLNAWLAEDLGLDNSEPLLAAAGNFFKLVVFTPPDHLDAVSAALFAGGAGHIGAYDCCSFRTTGTGTFRPGAGTNPFSGTIGETEAAEEIRLETIVPQARLSRVLEKMVQAHPYEEVAYDLIPLANQVPGAGLGRIGSLAEATILEAFAVQVKTALQCDHLRVAGDPQKTVRKVAVCGGSGASVIKAALQKGADLLVTGDIKYHDARLAEQLGIGLIDAGHFATERLMTRRLANVLRKASEDRGWQVDCRAYDGEDDPFRIY